MPIQELAAQYGWIGAILLYALVEIIKAGIRAANVGVTKAESETKQDDTVRELLVSINEERKAAQERERLNQQQNNHLHAELTDLKVAQGKEAGRREEIKEAQERERNEWKEERTEWKKERASFDDKIRTMESNILDLQKNQRDNQAKIRELESQIVTLNKRIEDKDGEIVSLKATLLQLQTEKTQLLDLNTELRKQVDERNARIDNLSELNQRKQEAEITPAPQAETPTPLTDATVAIPDMRDVDDTLHPLPEPPALPVTSGNDATVNPNDNAA